jgi:tRNA nucleotidyltransferase (CCA-adding enzyme)
VLTHDGQSHDAEVLLPRHHGHESAPSGSSTRCARAYRCRIAFATSQCTSPLSRQVHRAAELKPQTIVKLIGDVDGLRQPQRFEEFLLACEIDARGRKKRSNSRTRKQESCARRAARAVDASALRTERGLDGAALGRRCMPSAKAVKAALRDR